MENTLTWLLIADAGKARLFSMHKAKFLNHPKPDELTLIQQFTHAASRMKSSELAADRMGEFDRGTFVADAASPKLQEAEIFAQELLSQIKTGHQENRFRDLVLVAPPTFMGLLHKHMPHELQKVISQRIEKDYTQQNNLDLVQHLIQHF